MARLANYELGPLIGRGTQGQVHSATDVRSGARVAIKVVPWPRTSSPAERTETLERFRREVAVSEALSHPALARVADSGSTAEGLWIAMEFLDGTPLSEFATEGRLLEPRRVLRVVIAAAEVLAHVHSRGVVHRDVTPANLILLDSDRVKLLDFGVARFADSSLTNTGEFLGTPQAISPEQIEGGKPGPAADQYALAATTFRLLSGHWPFDGRDPGEIFEAALACSPQPLAIHRPELPGAVARCLERALSRDPTARYPGVVEFAQDLAVSFDADTVLPQRIDRAAESSGRLTADPPPHVRRVGAVVLLVTLVAVAVFLKTFPFRLEERIARRAESGNVASAAQEVADWKRLSPTSGRAELADGHVRFSQGDAQGALAAYSRALDLDPRRTTGDPRVIRNVIASLENEGSRATLLALAPQLPRSIEAELWRATEDPHYWRRWNAIRMLEARGHGEDVDRTLAYIADLQHAGSCSTRRRAAEKLGEIGDARALAPLAEARNDKRNRYCFMGTALDDAEHAIRAR